MLLTQVDVVVDDVGPKESQKEISDAFMVCFT